jgi:orotidine-5'-phosphate decarboxylase
VDLSTPASRICPALDMPWDQSGSFIEQMVAEGIKRFKVGLRAIHTVGTPAAVAHVKKYGGQVFLDAKLPDTPDTMRDSAVAICSHNVAAFNLHASSSIRSMRAAQQAAAPSNTTVLAVSVLTSMTPEEAELVFGASVPAKVLQFARDAVLAGMTGMINSPLELTLFLRHDEISGLQRWTPGIRPDWAVAGQQKRHTTPLEAITQGATVLIIGSPLYKPPSSIGTPEEAAKRIIGEIEQGLTNHGK